MFTLFAGVNVSHPMPYTTSGIGGPCPAGFYCPQQTEDPLPCPNTTYRDATNGAAPADCIPCKPGMYCGSVNLTDASGPCQAGFFCLTGNNVPNPDGK